MSICGCANSFQGKPMANKRNNEWPHDNKQMITNNIHFSMDVHSLLSFHYRLSIMSVTSDLASSWKNFSQHGPINAPSFSIVCCFFCACTSRGCSYFIPTLYVFVSILVLIAFFRKLVSENSSHVCFSLKNIELRHVRIQLTDTLSIRGRDFFLSWLRLSPCSWFPKCFISIWTASPVIFHKLRKINEIINFPHCFHLLLNFSVKYVCRHKSMSGNTIR